MPKDYNRRKINEAENEVIRLFKINIYPQVFNCEKVYRSSWFQRRMKNMAPNGDPFVNWKCCEDSPIPFGSMHSLAHLATSEKHDVEFIKMYLEIVEHIAGKQTKREFKKALIARNVRTKEVSDYTREQMRKNWYARNIDPEEAKENLRKIFEELGKEGQ